MLKLNLYFLSFSAAIVSSTKVHAGYHPCDLKQVAVEADAFLKLKHRTAIVHRSIPVGKYNGSTATEYTFTYVAIDKDPQFKNDGMIGTLTIPVEADGTCGHPRPNISSTHFVETKESYTFQDMIKDIQQKAP